LQGSEYKVKVMRSFSQYYLCILYLFGVVASSNIDPDEVRAEKIDVRPLGKKITEEKDLVKNSLSKIQKSTWR